MTTFNYDGLASFQGNPGRFSGLTKCPWVDVRGNCSPKASCDCGVGARVGVSGLGRPLAVEVGTAGICPEVAEDSAVRVHVGHDTEGDHRVGTGHGRGCGVSRCVASNENEKCFVP